MKWSELAEEPCSVARSVAVIGDRWTLMILRDCFLGVRRFEDFGRRLGISRAIISDRLRRLVDEGVLRREAYQQNPVRHEYRLTDKGLALHSVIMAIVHWGDVYYSGEAGPPLIHRHRACGCDFSPLMTCSECGEPVAARDVEVRPGGGGMSEVTLRTGGPADAEAIRALTREAYAKWVPLIGREPLPMTVDYAQAMREHRFDLLYVGEALAALIETTSQGDELLIVNVAVEPAHQGRGHGVRLMKLAEDLAREAGLKGTRLYTNQRFEENLRLYASLGYAVEREEALNGGVAVHMTKPLS